MTFFPKNIFHIWNTYNFEGKFLGYWIEIFGYWKIVFGSIASYLYYFPLSVSYRYGNLYRPIPITIPIRHFPYRQNRYIGRYRYCIGRTLLSSDRKFKNKSHFVLFRVHMYFYRANGSALIHSDIHTSNKHVIFDNANFELLFF